jgi:hypothetical protein
LTASRRKFLHESPALSAATALGGAAGRVWAQELDRPALIVSRAVDESGYVQPSIEQLTKVLGMRSIYHNHAIQLWKIDAGDRVSNVHLRSDVEATS